MATDDYTLQKEVRVQTGLTDESVLSDENLRTLVSRAKSEIEDEIGKGVENFYATNDLEGALFWLTCIFAVGEGVGGGDAFSIGELEYRPGDGQSYPMAWDARYEKYLAGIQGNRLNHFGSSTVNRTDRVYE